MELTYLKPMLCASADVPVCGPDWIAEPKLDGWRLLAVRDHDCVRIYGGRNGRNYTGRLPYLEGALFDALPAGTVLDGELVGDSFAHVQTVMKSNVAHTPTHGQGALRFVAFDVLCVDSEDWRGEEWMNRRTLLEDLLAAGVPHVELSRIVVTQVKPRQSRSISCERSVDLHPARA